MDRVRATNHPLSLAHDEEMRARHGSALDGGNALRRSRSRSGFGSRDSGEGFGSFDERGGGLLVSAGKPRRSARTRLNRVRSRLSGAAAARVKRFKKLPSAAKAVRVIAALLAFAGASDVLMRVGGLARGDAGTPPTPPTPYRPSALAATQAGLYARRRSVADSRDGGSRDDAAFASHGHGPGTETLIPRLIHQTYKSRDVPEAARRMMATWTDRNPTWRVRFYDDAACVSFVRSEFPEYYDAYVSLPKDVERSDFFRYLVVLRLGGIYADVDTECAAPLDTFLRPRDALVVGWEGEFDTDEMAYSRHFVRRRQVLNWAFAAAPGHPALREVCDRIKENARHVFSNNTNRDTLERTGPGAFTDVVLRHFWKYSAARRVVKTPGIMPDELGVSSTETETETETAAHAWSVRVLPKVSFGTHPTGEDGVSQDDPGVLVAHKFLGSWKSKKGWSDGKSFADLLRTFWHSVVLGDIVQHRARASRLDRWYSMPPVTAARAYPVSCASHDPPFDALTHLWGSDPVGSRGSAAERSGASLTKWGVDQPGRDADAARRPTSADALVGSLEPSSSSREDGGDGDANDDVVVEDETEDAALVDVGAGLGYFSLAAASRGFRALAVEPDASARELLAASAAHNGFEREMDLRAARVGGGGEAFCAALVSAERRRARAAGGFPSAAVEHAALVTEETLRVARMNRGEAAGGALGAAGGGRDAGGSNRQPRRRGGARRASERDGDDFDDFDDFGFRADADDVPTRAPRFACALAETLGFVTLDDVVLRHAASASPDRAGAAPPRYRALRVASDGWELHVLEGAREWLSSGAAPETLLVEVTPAKLFTAFENDARAAERAAAGTFEWLASLGYVEGAHAGQACDARRSRATAEADARDGAGTKTKSSGEDANGWCAFEPADVPFMARASCPERPESVLLRLSSDIRFGS